MFLLSSTGIPGLRPLPLTKTSLSFLDRHREHLPHLAPVNVNKVAYEVMLLEDINSWHSKSITEKQEKLERRWARGEGRRHPALSIRTARLVRVPERPSFCESTSPFRHW